MLLGDAHVHHLAPLLGIGQSGLFAHIFPNPYLSQILVLLTWESAQPRLPIPEVTAVSCFTRKPPIPSGVTYVS